MRGRSGRRRGRVSYRSRDGGHSWHGVAHTGAIGVAFLEKHVVVVDGAHVGVGGFGAARLAERPAGRSIVAVSSPYYRTSRLYGLDPEGRLWLSVRGGRRWAPLRAAGLPSGCGALSAVRGDPLKADVVYVACGRAGLWRSSDFGASFTRLAASPDATAVATTTDDHHARPRRRRGRPRPLDERRQDVSPGGPRGRASRPSRSICATTCLLRGGRPHAPAIGRRRRHVVSSRADRFARAIRARGPGASTRGRRRRGASSRGRRPRHRGRARSRT